MVTSQQHIEIRFTIFPLLMAGFSTTHQREKEEVLTILKIIENHRYGGSKESTRRFLESIFEKQRMAALRIGTANSVDLVEEMKKRGFIIYGL
jgi:hypothetical protein